MQKSVSQTIINKWLENIADTDIDPVTTELLKELASKKGLADSKALKEVIAIIEDENAKSQDD